jgi:hypothetical protein
MKYAALIILLLALPVRADNDAKRAMRHLQRAIMRVPLVKQTVKSIEKRALKRVSLDKKDLKYLIPLAILNAQVIDTSRIAPVKVQLYQGELRPIVRYNVQSGEMNTMVVYNFDF